MKHTPAGLIATSFRTLPEVSVYRPRSLAEAVRILADCDVPPALLAGGTDIVAQFNEGVAPERILALSAIGELRRIAVRDGTLHVGALVTHAAGSTDETVRTAVPGLAAAWGRIANVRVRFTATLGGNLVASRTRYEMPIVLSAVGAQAELAGPAGTYRTAVADLAREPMSSRVVLTGVAVPLTGLLAFDYDRTLRPIMTQALCIRRDRNGLHARLVIGTEAMRPHVLDFRFPHDDPRRVGENAPDVAREALRLLPGDACDPMTTNSYLRTTGAAILVRQLRRVDHEAA